MLPEFKNPRKFAEFDNWPIGGSRHGKCRFEIETTKKGSRIVRTTTDQFGNWCKPKTTTYAHTAVIVDGADGRTYILQDTGGFSFVHVWSSDLKTTASIWPKDERFHDLCALILQPDLIHDAAVAQDEIGLDELERFAKDRG